ncbi:MAG: hypothetical protein RBT64_11070, partial [Trichloromonas sp.]|nr:hypothetical protein [Trichloromonas sp.]
MPAQIDLGRRRSRGGNPAGLAAELVHGGGEIRLHLPVGKGNRSPLQGDGADGGFRRGRCGGRNSFDGRRRLARRFGRSLFFPAGRFRFIRSDDPLQVEQTLFIDDDPRRIVAQGDTADMQGEGLNIPGDAVDLQTPPAQQLLAKLAVETVEVADAEVAGESPGEPVLLRIEF